MVLAGEETGWVLKYATFSSFWFCLQQEKDSIEIEPECLAKVDEYGFFMHWKSEPRVGAVFSFALIVILAAFSAVFRFMW